MKSVGCRDVSRGERWIGERGWFVCCSEIVWDRCGLCDKVRLCGRGVCVKYSGN